MATTYKFTTRDEMIRLFKRVGIEFRVNDAPFDDTILDFYIDDATSQIQQQLIGLYNNADLNTSPWVRVRATWMACYFLSQAGGNPALFYGRYEAILKELENVRNNMLPIPGENGEPIPARYESLPALSNIEHDPRYMDATRREDPETSVPQSGGTRPRNFTDLPGFSLY